MSGRTYLYALLLGSIPFIHSCGKELDHPLVAPSGVDNEPIVDEGPPPDFDRALAAAVETAPISGPGTQQQCDPYSEPWCNGGGGAGGAPPSYGYRLTGLTMTKCRNRTVTGIDADADGLDDECEWRVASAFRPSLRFSSGEPLASKEPYWMAHVRYACTTALTDDLISYHCIEWMWVIRVMYLLAYHRDSEHIGDSEFLIVDVAYVSSDDMWRNSRMYTSAHWTSFEDRSGWSYHWLLEYPSGTGMTYPRSWVSLGKHANYPTRSGCNTNGPWLPDTCHSSGWDERVPIRKQDNIGEKALPLKMTVLSRSGYPGNECFWCTGYFDGWYLSSDNTPGYKAALDRRMASPNTVDYSLIN